MTSVSCGDSHTVYSFVVFYIMHHTPKVFLCAGGDVFACGNSDDGQLGNGSTDMQVIPRAVAGVSSSHIDIIACGLM